MSYVVHIWEHPSPATWAEADALHERLAGQAAPPNPKFVQLAHGLRQAFPDASCWPEGEPDGHGDAASWALGIAAPRIDSVMPVLVGQAVELGLTVYDGQSGEAYLPGPLRLTPQGREPLEWASRSESGAPAAVDGRAWLEARLHARVLPRFAAQGFELVWQSRPPEMDALVLARQTALGEQRIRLTPGSWSDEQWQVWLTCEIEPRLPEDLAQWCKPQHTISLVCAEFPGLAAFYQRPEYRRPFDFAFECVGREQLEQFLGLYADWVARELLPVLDSCADLKGYLGVDGRPAGPGVFVEAAWAGMALAHCAGDKALADRAERYGQQAVSHPRLAMFRRCLAGLADFPQHFGLYAGLLQ